MNTQTTAVAGVIALALVLAGGLFFYTQSNDASLTATSTPTGTDTTDTTPGSQSNVPGAPVATTNANVEPTNTTAILVGGVNPNGALTTYWYEYGASANLGILSVKQNIGGGYVPLVAPAYITQLAKDTTYYFRLVAQNQFGKSTGATYTFRTDTNTPAPVGGIPSVKTSAATGINRTAATVQGQVTPNKAATKYWFEYGTTADLGNISPLQSVGNGSAAVAASFGLSQLAPATTYYFRLDAQNQFGTVTGTTLSFNTAGPAISLAPVVTTQIVSPVAATTATIRGTVNPSNVQTTYWFEYSTDSRLSGSSLKTTQRTSLSAGSDTAAVIANLSNLRTKTTYYYRTVAQNSAGTSRGESMSFKTN